MIRLELFHKHEKKFLYLATLWNQAEQDKDKYEVLFISNPHELAQLIGETYQDWQEFLSDSRVQTYIDKIIYTNAGIVINRLMQDPDKLSMSDTTKLNTAIKYRDDHRESFDIPVQYIYMHTPLTDEEKEWT